MLVSFRCAKCARSDAAEGWFASSRLISGEIRVHPTDELLIQQPEAGRVKIESRFLFDILCRGRAAIILLASSEKSITGRAPRTADRYLSQKS